MYGSYNIMLTENSWSEKDQFTENNTTLLSFTVSNMHTNIILRIVFSILLVKIILHVKITYYPTKPS